MIKWMKEQWWIFRFTLANQFVQLAIKTMPAGSSKMLFLACIGLYSKTVFDTIDQTNRVTDVVSQKQEEMKDNGLTYPTEWMWDEELECEIRWLSADTFERKGLSNEMEMQRRQVD